MKAALFMLFIGILALFLAGCGYEARGNELRGYVKRIVSRTPSPICDDFYQADIAIGGLRDGSTYSNPEDIWVDIHDVAMYREFRSAFANETKVRITYDVPRFDLRCGRYRVVTSINEI